MLAPKSYGVRVTAQLKLNEIIFSLLTKRIKDGSGVLTTKINKHTTRKEIEALKIADNKTSESKTVSKSKSTKQLDLASIYVSTDLLYFTGSGTKRGHLKIEEVEKLHNAIRDLIKQHDKGKKHYKFQSNFIEVRNQYKVKENHNFGASILAKSNKRK